MQKLKPGLNILLGVTYVLIVVAALAIITLSVTTFVGKYFLQQRADDQKKALGDCALDLTPYMADRNPNYIYEILSSCAIAQNGRILFIDNNGIVQVDTFCRLNGTHPEAEEIRAVLEEGADSSMGYHVFEINSRTVTRDNPYLGSAKNKYWAAYYTQTVITGGEISGVLLLSSPVQDIVENTSSVSRGLMIFGAVFTLLIGGVTFYVTNILTLSIRKFNRAILKMRSGDFSVRVDENEIAEFGELAKAFNMMTSRLENLDASRNQFVSDASHELKTPLASMKILSEALLTQPDAPVELYREFMTDINAEIDRLSLVINDLLTLVKTDKGMETLILAPVEWNELLARIVNTVEPLARKKHITISYEYSEVTLQADELRLQQLCTNLIDNAIKYSPENTTVTVTLTQTLSSAVFSVTDQGIGISEENLPHLFERFYRVDKARSRQAGGTGLGLSIVKQIVDQHGGSIEVQSQLNKGTTFTVTLPLVPKEATE